MSKWQLPLLQPASRYSADMAVPMFIVSGQGSKRQAGYEGAIRRLVDGHLGRYSEPMTVRHQANTWPLDAPTHSHSGSLSVADGRSRPVSQILAAR
jgi:hypothetical protein